MFCLSDVFQNYILFIVRWINEVKKADCVIVYLHSTLLCEYVVVHCRYLVTDNQHLPTSFIFLERTGCS